MVEPIRDHLPSWKPTLRLLLLDLKLVNTRYRLSAIGIFLLVALQTVGVGPVYLAAGVILALALAFFAPAVEWYHSTAPTALSLPVDRRDRVAARYLAALVAVCVAWITWQATGRILLPLLHPHLPGPAIWDGAAGNMAFTGTSLGLIGLALPPCLRHGVGRGALWATGLLLLLAAAALVAWALTGRSPDPLSLAAALVRRWGPGRAVGLTLVAAGVGLTLSWLLARRWHERFEP